MQCLRKVTRVKEGFMQLNQSFIYFLSQNAIHTSACIFLCTRFSYFVDFYKQEAIGLRSKGYEMYTYVHFSYSKVTQ